MTNKEIIQHLETLCRNSTEIEFHIPVLFFTKTQGLEQRKQEVKEAIEYFAENKDFKFFNERNIKYRERVITIKIEQ